MGLWGIENGYFKNPPLGYPVTLDAFYSDIRTEYIVYHYEVADDGLGDLDISFDPNKNSSVCLTINFFLKNRIQ